MLFIKSISPENLIPGNKGKKDLRKEISLDKNRFKKGGKYEKEAEPI